ncbi:MAG: hypothetical protein B6D54_00850 [Epsilonproteobacteria bacterium 4484_65]|nr:MAG: hypothetical protein B6D54_00850 [Epsilonproteobacteria bacterium 4484_65]
MKKLIGLIVAGVAVFALSGCGGGDDDYYAPPPSNLTTLFLIDQDGFSLGGVPYICDSMVDWSATRPNGEFTFDPPDNCTFDFIGLNGNYNNDPFVDDIIYIVDDLDRGKGNIPYDCASFGASTTYGDGSFDYDIDDECVFYF